MRINEPICLYQGDMILWAGDESDRGKGKITFHWLPSPETRFEMVGTQHSINHVRAVIEYREVEIELPGGYSQKASAKLSSNTSIDLAGQEPPKYHGVLARYYDKVKIPKCDTVEFFLTNFRLAQSLKNKEWTIDIDPLTQDLKSTFDALECEMGYAVTHSGILRRADGSPFTLDQANDALYALHQFYSFIQGEWSGPVLCKGMLEREITWERWGNPNITPFKSQTGVARSAQFDQSKAFEGFMRMWADTEWKETIEPAVHLYIEANNMSMVEGAIILLQSALERLAWGIANSRKKDVTKLKNADARINWLLREIGLPTELPPSLTSLWSYSDTYSSNIQYPDKAKKEGTKLGAYILTYLRNGIIHPDEKLKRITSATIEAKWDAKRLGLWYVATILLSLMDYTEEYMSPITWQTERIPLKCERTGT